MCVFPSVLFFISFLYRTWYLDILVAFPVAEILPVWDYILLGLFYISSPLDFWVGFSLSACDPVGNCISLPGTRMKGPALFDTFNARIRDALDDKTE